MSEITVSAAIVSYNCKDTVYTAVESLKNYSKKYPVELTVYDNASCDGTVQKLKSVEDIKVVSTGSNLGFGKAHNLALKGSLGKYHAVINPDITLNTDVIAQLVDFLEDNPDTVMVTPKILNSDGTVQQLPKRKPSFKYMYLGRLSKFIKPFKKFRDEYTMANTVFDSPADIDFCTGCFFVIRSDVFKKLGGFDENMFMYMEDADLTRRAKNYGRTVYYPDVGVTHIWERNSAKSLKYLLIHFKSSLYYFVKWRKG